jgi:hypothetical protein
MSTNTNTNTKQWEHGGSTADGEAWVWEADAKLLYEGGEDGPPEYEDTRLFSAPAPLAEQICREHNAHASLLAACEDAIEELRTDENYVGENGAEAEFLVKLRAAVAMVRKT